MSSPRSEYYKYLEKHIKIADVCKFLNIELRPVGNDYICHCFFHDDSHPSMHIYTESNKYYCFQCGENGNIFQLIKAKLKCDFKESVAWLEERFPEVLSEKPALDSKNNDQYENGFELAWFSYAKMSQTEQDQLKEFAEKRQYKCEDLIEAEIVFAKGKKLGDKYGSEAEYIEERNLLQEVGLLQKVPKRERDITFEKYEDFFKTDRVIVALRDEKKQIIGFVGRSVFENDKPKYLFTKNFNKENWLYGFYKLKANLVFKGKTKKQDLYLVEGIFDVLRLRKQGKTAVAVMGSHLLTKQSNLIADYIKQADYSVTVHICMDSDDAGLQGCYRTIKNLWKHSILRHTEIVTDILVGAKDPDEFYQEKEGIDKKEIVTYSTMEFLFRYYLRGENQSITEIDVAKAYAEKSTEEKIRLLHSIENMMSKDEWGQLFAWRQLIGENSETGKTTKSEQNLKNEIKDPEEFSWEYIRRYVLDIDSMQEYTNEKEKDYLFHMNTALQIARTSDHNLLLDENTWDRIATGADAFFPYLYEMLRNQNTFTEIPMIEIMIPKKKEEFRRKSFYIHEESILQQYVLNELLSRGNHILYEKFVPAVRYAEGEKTYVTGYGVQEEVVSFAYQIDMSAVNGEKEIHHGMFRPFYDCWKEYIQYVQEGIAKLDGETVYRVKLDIRGFYDNIKKNVVRDALYPSIREALLKDETKFRCFRQENDTEDNCAIRLINWILSELFKKECYSAETGQFYIREDYDCGIPQGPNLSAYVANIVLFELDKKILQIVQQINKRCDSEHIAARYCRYVDDMIIITSESEDLLKIKNAIAAILYDMGLELSNKTEAEDGVSKEDAIEWTVDARGGLGVSIGYDIADDTLESVMDDCNEYDVVDRRTALKLINSMLSSLLHGDMTEEMFQKQGSASEFQNIIFRVEKIRINDMIRVSEFLIYRASEKEGKLLEEYQKIWEDSMEMCPDDSVLWMKGIDIFVFLEGCLKILQREKEIDRKNIYGIWNTTVNKIQEVFKKNNHFLQKLSEEMLQSELLKKNAWVVRLRYFQICSLLKEDAEILRGVNSFYDNEYSERCIWLLRNSKDIWNIDKKTSILQSFHFILMMYQNADTENEIKEVNSRIKNYKKELLNISERNILTDCMRIWINRNKTVRYSEDTVKIALKVLLNSLRYGIKAEVVGENPLFSNYLFANKENLQILPVFPGVDYPGIIAYVIENQKIEAERVDFQTSGIKTGHSEIWKINDEKQKVIDDLTYYTAEFSEKNYFSLEEYFSKEIKELHSDTYQESTIEQILQKTTDVYPVLVSKIQEIYDKYPDDRILLSKKNVILCRNKKEGFSVDLGMSYLISDQKISGAVAVEKDSKYILQQVNESGAPYWIAGRILADTIQLDQISLKREEREKDVSDCVEMLRYSFKRLQGYYLNFRGAITHRTRHSFENTMHRTIKNIKSFLGQTDLRRLYLESAKIENNFIAFRLRRNEYQFEDSSLEIAIWAKNALRISYRKILPIVENDKGEMVNHYEVIRRVPKWYCYLADKLLNMINNDERDTSTFIAIDLLGKGLLADAVLLNLRMQTLERIRALSKEERRVLSEQIDVPYAELGIEENCVLITGKNKEKKWSRLWKNLLNLKTDINIRSVTHIGWIVMMSKLYEVDKTVGFVIKENKSLKETSVTLMKKMISMVSCNQSQKEVDEEFPYEGLENFYGIWDPEAVQQMISIMNQLDKISGIEVKEQKSETYSQKVREADVIIDCEDDHLVENKYFLTFSKIGNGIFELEKDLENSQKFVYSITKKKDQTLGISTIIFDFGRLLQIWEGKSDSVSAVEKEIGDGNNETSDMTSMADNNNSENNENNTKNRNSGIFAEQKKLWAKRKKTFSNFDRIAIFQFNIDNTYYSPSLEICINYNAASKSDKMSPSCAEFRRKKILEQVLEACNLFDVEILLLPEYSVRPETVEWIAEKIENEGYRFAVWAGTFRIPVDHKFDRERYWKDASDLNNKNHFHAAILPVIVPKNSIGEDGVTILTNKAKKYPSIALHEEINPIPAEQGNFKPVIRKRFEDRYNKNILFGNAWDDVTEVICAEMFALSAICNYPSFLTESYKAYKKYQTSVNGMSLDKYKEQMFEDIKTYGQYTSIYQFERRYGRTPVVLVPACTTRSTDYYIWGQGQYLAAGIKTVLCNSAGKETRGGSCFIGQDSWDNHKIEHDEKRLANTIYHGLKPGIYSQSSRAEDRGALGTLEQALLICDVNPQYEKSNPTAESTIDSLSVVAHIPIIEVRSRRDSCERCENPYICNVIKKGMVSENEVHSMVQQLINISKDTMQFRNTIELKNTHNNKVKDIAAALEKLGKFCNSDWLCRRGNFFRKYFVPRPESWIAPTVLDWIYVEIDYDEFHRVSDTYLIQVTE